MCECRYMSFSLSRHSIIVNIFPSEQINLIIKSDLINKGRKCKFMLRYPSREKLFSIFVINIVIVIVDIDSLVLFLSLSVSIRLSHLQYESALRSMDVCQIKREKNREKEKVRERTEFPVASILFLVEHQCISVNSS